ncbi:hypothetical protein L1987_07082 [Smallanthus sonchifolius]|uniref:Uncharacterized protein n=1 Tax=Smallanthus sonchifolius TaxID=185202 RepID=A0ACB9JZW6_9ASTR|nr:hypothetical protein L1987_07082 [Smallanthus sonchifolius]
MARRKLTRGPPPESSSKKRHKDDNDSNDPYYEDVTVTPKAHTKFKKSTPHISEAHLKDVLDTLNKARYVPPGSSSTTTDKDDQIKALEARVGMLEAQVSGLQGGSGEHQDTGVNPDSQAQEESQSESKEVSASEGADKVKGVEATEALDESNFEDSESEYAKNLECLLSLDDDVDDDVMWGDEDEENVEIEIGKDVNEVTYQADNGIEFIPMLLDTISDIEGSLETEQDVPDINEELEVEKHDEPEELYRNTGMTKKQWTKIKNTWWKEKSTAPPSPILKSKSIEIDQVSQGLKRVLKGLFRDKSYPITIWNSWMI